MFSRTMGQSKKIISLGIDWGFLDDVHILGIHAPALEMYRFAYFLNEAAQWDLSRGKDYSPNAEDEADKDEDNPEEADGMDGAVGRTGPAGTAGAVETGPSYALFQFYLMEDHLQIYLLENKQPEPLVPSEDCDYFLIACGFVDCFDFNALTELIENNIEDIFQVYEVDASRHDALKLFLLTHGQFPDE